MFVHASVAGVRQRTLFKPILEQIDQFKRRDDSAIAGDGIGRVNRSRQNTTAASTHDHAISGRWRDRELSRGAMADILNCTRTNAAVCTCTRRHLIDVSHEVGNDRAIGDDWRRGVHVAGQDTATGSAHDCTMTGIGTDHECCGCPHGDVRLHAEVPLIALLGLVHLGIARPAGILGRRRRVVDRGIDDGARRRKLRTCRLVRDIGQQRELRELVQ